MQALKASILNRLTKVLSQNKENNIKSLVAYLVAGDPCEESTLELLNGFALSGVDVIEVGVPFSDPIAEGPIIQSAHDRSLKNGTNLKKILKIIKSFRKSNSHTPIVLMGYINGFLANQSKFKNFSQHGVDGVLIVDVPGEYSLGDIGFQNDSILSVSLISPTTSKERVSDICKASSGFIYYITLRGVTGANKINVNEIHENLLTIKKSTDLPVLAGFGIKTKEDATEISKLADGVIIGSQIVEMVKNSASNKDFKKIYNYLKEIKHSINL